MILTSLSLQNFRSYKKTSFDFSEKTTVILGPNTAGKTNIIEAIYLLSHGKSFKAEKDVQLVALGSQIAHVKGVVDGQEEEVLLEVVLQKEQDERAFQSLRKRYLVNGVARRRVDFATHLPTVLFSPIDVDLITGGPSLRRAFFDEVLEQVDREYLLATTTFSKALRQRNALLEIARETGRGENQKEFAYWDEQLIANGSYITKKREAFTAYINAAAKRIFDCRLIYDKSEISRERLDKYSNAELASGLTLVGPHRDDFWLQMLNHKIINGSESESDNTFNLRHFGSRGQQRLAVLQLKFLQLQFLEETLQSRPLLLLDDIFSELDDSHIKLVLSLLHTSQTILTTTHEEFIAHDIRKDVTMIELEKYVEEGI